MHLEKKLRKCHTRNIMTFFNSNFVLVARHSQYKVEVFCKAFILNGPLENTNYYVIRFEFQLRGIPHSLSQMYLSILNDFKCTSSEQ